MPLTSSQYQKRRAKKNRKTRMLVAAVLRFKRETDERTDTVGEYLRRPGVDTLQLLYLAACRYFEEIPHV